MRKKYFLEVTRRSRRHQLTLHSRGGPYAPWSPEAFRGGDSGDNPANLAASRPPRWGLKVLGFVNAGTLCEILEKLIILK